MDGDGPDLARLVEIKERFECWLMVDEAHSLGILGKTRQGPVRDGRYRSQAGRYLLGTLSKTLVSCGGYVRRLALAGRLSETGRPRMVIAVGMPAPGGRSPR